MSIEPAELTSDRTRIWPSTESASIDDHYRVAAFPADYALTNDVILRDETGRAFLLSQADEELLPIEEDTANSLGMFFEPSQDSSWHTVSELRRIIYGLDDTVVSIH
ncbi:MAG TPA: hypothetical protein VFV93_14395 [Thermomicrobiales bacterium]|jgi:hypothetical protein|nr:hypothetical protein [Thermomicrobiales bacterium]